MPGIKPRALCVLYQAHKWSAANTPPLQSAACQYSFIWKRERKYLKMNQAGIRSFCLLDFNMVKTHREHRGACHQQAAINQRGQPRRILCCLPLATLHFLGPLLNLFSFYTPQTENYSCVTSFQKINIKSSCPNHHDFRFLFSCPLLFFFTHTHRGNLLLNSQSWKKKISRGLILYKAPASLTEPLGER